MQPREGFMQVVLNTKVTIAIARASLRDQSASIIFLEDCFHQVKTRIKQVLSFFKGCAI